MKKLSLIVLLFAFSFSLANVKAFAEDRNFSNLPDSLLYEEEAAKRIIEFTERVNSLEAVLKGLEADVTKNKTEIEKSKTALVDCRKEILKLVNASEADVANFRQKLGVIQAKVRSYQSLSNEVLSEKQDELKALENDLNALRVNKIAVMPEFFDKIIATAKDIRDLQKRAIPVVTSKTYIVKTWAKYHDCLWNIAKKPEFYGDPLMWPKIWQANPKVIKSPDLIHPGDELTIPQPGAKTDDELKSERKYWRKKGSMSKPKTETEKGKK